MFYNHVVACSKACVVSSCNQVRVNIGIMRFVTSTSNGFFMVYDEVQWKIIYLAIQCNMCSKN